MQNQTKNNLLSDVTIRPMQIDDYSVVIELWNRAELPYKPQGRDRKSHIARELEDSTAIFLIAEHKTRIVGTVFGTHDGRKGWINRLAVDPDYRKLGIARKLMTELEQRLDSIGIDIFACLIEDWNTVSMKAFKHLGYMKHDDIAYFSKRKHPGV
jgi:ribosomal protein S18 acetylase RimI-like enzyme